MAVANNGDNSCRCDTCGVTFRYPSHLERHMKTDSHRIFAEACLSVTEAQSDIITPTFSDDYQVEEDQGWDEPGLMEEDFGEASCDVEAIVMQDILSDSMESLSFGDSEDHDSGTGYHPFSNKLHALLYLLLHNPRPLGDSNLNFVLYMLKQCSPTCCPPSLSTLKKLSLPDYRPPVKFVNSDGVPFYVNTLSTILTRCFGNRHIAESLVRYPVKANTFKEIYHARRWLEDPRFLSHTALLPGGSCVFVHDFVYLHGHVMGKVQHLFQNEGTADIFASVDIILDPGQFCSALQRSPLPSAPGTMILFETCEVPLSTILSVAEAVPTVLNKWRLSENMCSNVEMEELQAYLSPSCYKDIARGKPMLTLPLILYSDDMSGNKSKKWHEFNNWCLMLAGLPRHINSQVSNIHLISFSDCVSTLEVTASIADELLHLETVDMEMFDAHLNLRVHYNAPLLLCICDNPRASELLNHRGSTARKPCRMCLVDRDHNTVADIQKRTEADKKELSVQYGLSEHHNPLFSISADLYRSTPNEVLHTVLLGPYKYLLKAVMKRLSREEKGQLLARLASFNYSGMESRITGNICYHHKSFVGRDYKALVQIAPFVLGPYLLPEEKEVWLALSEVFVICYNEHYNPEDKQHVQSLCIDFVTKAIAVYPELNRKPKVHLLLHLAECLHEFGPTSGYSAERLESHNGLLWCIHLYGNKQAPSHDVATRMAVIEHTRFVCSGGVLADGTRCGDDLARLYQSPPVQHFFNSRSLQSLHSSKAIYKPCALRKAKGVATFRDLSVKLNGYGMTSLTPTFTIEGQSWQLVDRVGNLLTEQRLQVYHALVSQDCNLVNIGNYVFCSQNDKEVYAELLLCVLSTAGAKLCVICPMELLLSSQGQRVCNEYDCPLLHAEMKVTVVPADSVLYSVSIVHECSHSCVFSVQSCQRTVERQAIDCDGLVYQHYFNNNLFCQNVVCMSHNFC